MRWRIKIKNKRNQWDDLSPMIKIYLVMIWNKNNKSNLTEYIIIIRLIDFNRKCLTILGISRSRNFSLNRFSLGRRTRKKGKSLRIPSYCINYNLKSLNNLQIKNNIHKKQKKINTQTILSIKKHRNQKFLTAKSWIMIKWMIFLNNYKRMGLRLMKYKYRNQENIVYKNLMKN